MPLGCGHWVDTCQATEPCIVCVTPEGVWQRGVSSSQSPFSIVWQGSGYRLLSFRHLSFRCLLYRRRHSLLLPHPLPLMCTDPICCLNVTTAKQKGKGWQQTQTEHLQGREMSRSSLKTPSCMHISNNMHRSPWTFTLCILFCFFWVWRSPNLLQFSHPSISQAWHSSCSKEIPFGNIPMHRYS